MNTDEKMEKMEGIQKYFVASFCISIILLLISTLLCMVMHDVQLAFVNKYFPLDDVRDYNFLVILILGMWKVLIIQFTLIPAIVIWGLKKCCKCNCKK